MCAPIIAELFVAFAEKIFKENCWITFEAEGAFAIDADGERLADLHADRFILVWNIQGWHLFILSRGQGVDLCLRVKRDVGFFGGPHCAAVMIARPANAIS